LNIESNHSNSTHVELVNVFGAIVKRTDIQKDSSTQIDIKMLNPLTDFDLEDFEALSEQYWEMELDADQFAKNMVAKIVIKLNIPIDVAKNLFTLSPYIENYPSMSRMVTSSLSQNCYRY